MSRRVVGFSVSPQLIMSALRMPEDCELIGAEWDFSTQSVRLYAEGKQFAPVDNGAVTPFVVPTIEQMGHDERGPVFVWNWNLPAVDA